MMSQARSYGSVTSEVDPDRSAVTILPGRDGHENSNGSEAAMEGKYDNMEAARERPLRWFAPLVVLAQLLSLAAVILVAVWMGHFRGGFAWQSDPSHEFNYHPLFMIIGLVFLYSNAMLVYRVFRNERKTYIKILHGVLQLLALVFVSVGLKAVFDSHNLPSPSIPNLYSLHSWLGISVVIMFAMQWVLGILIFFLPGMSDGFKTAYKQMHVFFGIAMFLMAVATSLTGITEKIFFVAEAAQYNKYSSEGIVVNLLGVDLVALAVVVVYLVANPRYMRQPLPEEERIQLNE